MREFQEGVKSLGLTLKTCAPMFFSYYLVLKEQGFTPDEALHLVAQLQEAILAQGGQ